MNFSSRKAVGFARTAALALAVAGAASAQNDECTTAIALLNNSVTPFATNAGATLSLPGWPCAGSTAPDLWYSYAATSSNQITISLCGSSYDCALEIFSGTCAALTSIACNDDFCGLQSQLSFTGAAGTTYFFRVGGFGAAAGTGTISITEQAPPPPPPACNGGIAAAPFLGGNQGNVGGALYFNMTVSAAVSISNMETNFIAALGTPVGMNVYTCATTHVGNEGNAAAWTQVGADNGTAQSAGPNAPTSIVFASPINLAAGTYGIALVAVGSAHAYTNGVNNFSSGVFSITTGAATNVPFTAPVFTPRSWNGRFCEGGPGQIGTNYCTAIANSTGNTADMGASGSAVVANNNLVLEASSMPNNAFGFFLTSTTQGFVGQPGGSQGNLCLGGQIGRYVGAGQIKNSGATGSFDLAVDLTQTPTPTGLVSVAAGQTRNFQAWYRDSVGGTATSNFTDGLSILFQ